MALTDMPQDMRDVVLWNGSWKEELILYRIYSDTTGQVTLDVHSKPNSSNTSQMFKLNFAEDFYQSVV